MADASVDPSATWLSGIRSASGRATALALALVLLLPGAAVDAVEPRGVERVCPPPDSVAADVPEFTDRGTTHGDAIVCAARYRLVSGFGDGTYRPGQAVTRGQTASVVAAWLEVATGFELDLPEERPFSDQGQAHADAISKLAAIEVIAGRDDGTFAPEEPLTRGQFARVVVNAISYADVFRIGGPLPPIPEPEVIGFDDVVGTAFEEDILALAGTGITTGVEEDRFAPGEEITRGQLATFLMRSADYLDRHQRWKPTAVVVVLIADLELVVGDGQDSDAAEPQEVGPPPSANASVVMINAFNGTAGYLVELSGLRGGLATDARLTLRLGDLDTPGPVVLTLADAAELEAALSTESIVTGVVTEAESAVRLAELVVREDGVVIELQGTPQGPLRGLLRPADR